MKLNIWILLALGGVAYWYFTKKPADMATGVVKPPITYIPPENLDLTLKF